jgi:NagD protein
MKKLNEVLLKTEYFLLDLDGTVYLGNEVIGNMPSTLNYLREKGKKIVYVSNNSSRGVKDYIKKLKKLNLYNKEDIIYTSSNATCDYLVDNYFDKTVYVLGTKSLIKQLKKSKIKVVDSDSADIALLAYDTTINYKKITRFSKVLNGGALYIATHPDICCPTETISLPDAGSFIKTFECCYQKTPAVVIGKPYNIMGEYLMKKFKKESSRFLMVGDRIYTDIGFGVNNGFNTLLVLSGESTMETVEKSDIKPEFILSSLNDIKNYF